MMTGAFLSLNYSALSSFYYNAILLLNYTMLFYCLIIMAGFMNYEVLFLNMR